MRGQAALFEIERPSPLQRRVVAALTEGAVLIDRSYDGWQVIPANTERFATALELGPRVRPLGFRD